MLTLLVCLPVFLILWTEYLSGQNTQRDYPHRRVSGLTCLYCVTFLFNLFKNCVFIVLRFFLVLGCA